jgi:hypothetical protein
MQEVVAAAHITAALLALAARAAGEMPEHGALKIMELREPLIQAVVVAVHRIQEKMAALAAPALLSSN